MANKTNAMIIDGILVPATEVRVLRALVEAGRTVTVSELVRQLEGSLSDASMYTLLRRLSGQRELVKRTEGSVDVQSVGIRRVFWTLGAAAQAHFETLAAVNLEGGYDGTKTPA